jgi:hypothetical protein
MSRSINQKPSGYNAPKLILKASTNNMAVVAQDKWLLSSEGVSCTAPTLPLSGGAFHLENRLKRAFMAGWNACKKNNDEHKKCATKREK